MLLKISIVLFSLVIVSLENMCDRFFISFLLMVLTRSQKVDVVDLYKKSLSSATNVVLLLEKWFTGPQLVSLRKSMSQRGIKTEVVRKRIFLMGNGKRIKNKE